MRCRHHLAGIWLTLTLLLGACQPHRPAEDGHAAPTVRPGPPMPPAPPPPAARATPQAAVRPEKQTLFPDSLRPIALPVDYWTGPQLDSIRAALPKGDTILMGSNVVQWAARCRVLRDDEHDELKLRLFVRLPMQPLRWAEFNLNPWLGEYLDVADMKAHLVDLDQRPPEELVVELSAGIYVQSVQDVRSHTLLISFDGPPRVIWHSVDSHNESIPPHQTLGQDEMEGGNYADVQRTIAVRRGRVQVGRARRVGKFENDDQPYFTPITPGSYQYRASRFRRVAP